MRYSRTSAVAIGVGVGKDVAIAGVGVVESLEMLRLGLAIFVRPPRRGWRYSTCIKSAKPSLHISENFCNAQALASITPIHTRCTPWSAPGPKLVRSKDTLIPVFPNNTTL